MVAVLAIADGADGEDDLGVGTMAAEQVDGSTQVVGTLVDGELFLLEKGGGALLAVVDDFARFLQTVDVVGAEGDEGDSGEPPPIPLQLEGEPSFNCMKYRGGVVHHRSAVAACRLVDRREFRILRIALTVDGYDGGLSCVLYSALSLEADVGQVRLRQSDRQHALHLQARRVNLLLVGYPHAKIGCWLHGADVCLQVVVAVCIVHATSRQRECGHRP